MTWMTNSTPTGMEEFPLVRPTIRSNAATRSTSRAFVALNSSITTSRDAHDPHPGAAQAAAQSSRHDRHKPDLDQRDTPTEDHLTATATGPLTDASPPSNHQLANDLNVPRRRLVSIRMWTQSGTGRSAA
jgi:hypothetical protein